jgi:hypothetical protein
MTGAQTQLTFLTRGPCGCEVWQTSMFEYPYNEVLRPCLTHIVKLDTGRAS